MDRRTAITTARTTARRIRTLSSKVAIRMGREVSERLAARRTQAPRSPAPPPQPAARSDVGSPESDPHAVPSPADVARVVQRNAAGLPRRSPGAQRTPRPRSAPGAKLPARAGKGILGV